MGMTIMLFIAALQQAFNCFVKETINNRDHVVLVERFTNSALALMSMVKEAAEHGIYPTTWADQPLVTWFIHPDTKEVTLYVSMDTQTCVEPCATLCSDYTFKVASDDTELYVKGDATRFDKWRKIIDVVR